MEQLKDITKKLAEAYTEASAEFDKNTKEGDDKGTILLALHSMILEPIMHKHLMAAIVQRKDEIEETKKRSS